MDRFTDRKVFLMKSVDYCCLCDKRNHELKQPSSCGHLFCKPCIIARHMDHIISPTFDWGKMTFLETCVKCNKESQQNKTIGVVTSTPVSYKDLVNQLCFLCCNAFGKMIACDSCNIRFCLRCVRTYGKGRNLKSTKNPENHESPDSIQGFIIYQMVADITHSNNFVEYMCRSCETHMQLVYSKSEVQVDKVDDGNRGASLIACYKNLIQRCLERRVSNYKLIKELAQALVSTLRAFPLSLAQLDKISLEVDTEEKTNDDVEDRKISLYYDKLIHNEIVKIDYCKDVLSRLELLKPSEISDKTEKIMSGVLGLGEAREFLMCPLKIETFDFNFIPKRKIECLDEDAYKGEWHFGLTRQEVTESNITNAYFRKNARILKPCAVDVLKHSNLEPRGRALPRGLGQDCFLVDTHNSCVCDTRSGRITTSDQCTYRLYKIKRPRAIQYLTDCDIVITGERGLYIVDLTSEKPRIKDKVERGVFGRGLWVNKGIVQALRVNTNRLIEYNYNYMKGRAKRVVRELAPCRFHLMDTLASCGDVIFVCLYVFGRRVPSEDLAGKSNILMYSADGVLLAKYGHHGLGLGLFKNPAIAGISENYEIVVVDHGSALIQVLDIKKKPLWTLVRRIEDQQSVRILDLLCNGRQLCYILKAFEDDAGITCVQLTTEVEQNPATLHQMYKLRDPAGRDINSRRSIRR